MKRFRFPAYLIAVLTICLHGAAGQTNVPIAQNNAGVAKNGSARGNNTRPNGPTSQHVGRGAIRPSAHLAYSRPIKTGAQRSRNSRSNYSALARPVNPTLTAMRARQSAQSYNVRPVPGLLARNDVVPNALPITNPQRLAEPDDVQPTRNIPAREEITPSRPARPGVHPGGKILRPTSDELLPREKVDGKQEHKSHGNKQRRSFSEAVRCHRHEWHDRNWWKQNCNTIVFVNSGYYFLDAGYWYPAWGYDPLNSYYDYDGPIYTYGNLLPDEVITNVQVALQNAGYYFGAITGSLSVETRAALANFQSDYGLPITGAIDPPTVETLGLY
jgi:Putative peptidoglycan binding domain